MVRTKWPLILSIDSKDAMNDLSIKLRLLKGKVRSWTKNETLKLKDKSAIMEDEINSLLHCSHSAILSAEEQCRLTSLKFGLQKIMDHELRSARLQSKQHGHYLGMLIPNFSMRWQLPGKTKMPSGVCKMKRVTGFMMIRVSNL